MEGIIDIGKEVYEMLRDFRAGNTSFIQVDSELRDLGFSHIEIHSLTSSVK